MKFLIKDKTPIIISKTFCELVGNLMLGKSAWGVAVFPFIIVRDEAIMNNEWLIRHETIHLRQYIETLVVGLLIIGSIQWLYAILILCKNRRQAYYYQAHEQEAHQNDQDVDYLKNRKWFSYYKYLLPKNKKRMDFIDGKRIIYEN